MTTEFRVVFTVHGGHVHCRLYTTGDRTTWALNGGFVVRRGEEFSALASAFDGAEFVGVGSTGEEALEA